ncbi:MAG: wax ester/triacylglycerol synthase family O-acyltransferase [Jiangellaceae bacterium]|nr:wax ester/triacylglycerol synthase family O-acyltransferase [Jiangellaceae bacterium]
MERLSFGDLLIFRSYQAGWPMDIGGLAILDGGTLFEPDGNFRIAAVQQAIERRLHLVPRFRQLLVVPRLGLGWPLWADDPAFDIRKHVRVLSLMLPGDEAELLRVVEQLRSTELDSSLPLWTMWFLPGLPDDQVAMFLKMHHAIADGLSGIALFGAFTDTEPNAPAALPQPWTPAPMPSRGQLFRDNVARRVAAGKEALQTLVHPVQARRRAAASWGVLSQSRGGDAPRPVGLTLSTGPERRLGLVRSELAAAKEVAHRYGVKLNDVLLTAIAGGLRELLVRRGKPVEDLVLRAYVPVSLHREDAGPARGNRGGMMFLSLPVGVADPVQRLWQIAPQTAEHKKHVQRPPSGVLARNGFLTRLFVRLAARRLGVDVYVANLPGPTSPLYLAGAPLLEMFPVVPVNGNLTLGVGALSYAGQLNLAAVGDQGGYPDLDVFTGAVRNTLGQLAGSVRVEAALSVTSHA